MVDFLTQRELRNNSGDVMRALDRGKEFIVTRNGTPVAELRPVRTTFVDRERVLDALRGAPALDGERLRQDLDLVAGQDPAPRT